MDLSVLLHLLEDALKRGIKSHVEIELSHFSSELMTIDIDLNDDLRFTMPPFVMVDFLERHRKTREPRDAVRELTSVLTDHLLHDDDFGEITTREP